MKYLTAERERLKASLEGRAGTEGKVCSKEGGGEASSCATQPKDALEQMAEDLDAVWGVTSTACSLGPSHSATEKLLVQALVYHILSTTSCGSTRVDLPPLQRFYALAWTRYPPPPPRVSRDAP